MLEKDKNCIEFSMHSMMATHKPYQEDTEIAITGMAPGKSLLLANNPFDIPCDVVVVSKRYFERLQTENEQLKKKLEEFSPVPGYREFLKALYPEATEATIEKLVWTTEQLCCGRDLQHTLQVDLTYYQALSSARARAIDSLKQAYEAFSKLVGFSSVEEIQDYLTNEAECNTLKEALAKLKDQVKYTCDEWYSANRRNNSWKAAAECNSPKELIEKRETLEKEIEVYSRTLKEWKEITGCPSPSAAKTLIESGMSWHHACNEIKEQNRKLADSIQKWKDMTKCETPEAAASWITSYESACGRGNRLAESVEKLKEEVVSWKNVTGYSTPEDYMHARINCATPFDYTAAWQKATGYDTPNQAKSHIKELEREVKAWEEVTGFSTPKNCSSYIDTLEKKLEDIKNLIEED